MSGKPVVQELQLLSCPPDDHLPQLPPPNGVPKLQNFKNKLQEYTQKYSLQLPVYQTINEGLQHAPQFRCTVLVDGKSYKSAITFPQRKLAEQDAARVALDDVCQKIKEDGRPVLCEDPIFCKSILNEYAIKLRVEKPTYHTVQQEGMLPVFDSLVNFNGVSYNGGTGRSKKEAEQLAARAAVLSILDSDPTQTISKIIKSKFKLYAALSKVRENSNAALPVGNRENGPTVPLTKREEPEVAGIDINTPLCGISQPNIAEVGQIQAALNSHHAFKKPRTGTPNMEISLPIAFVSPGSEQLQLPSTLLQLPPTLGVKQSRKSKRTAKKRLEVNSQAPTVALPLQQIPPGPVTQ